MKNERFQQLRAVFQYNQRVPNMLSQFVHIGGSEITQLPILGPTPHRFIRVGVGSMGWEVLHQDFGMFRQPGTNDPRLTVDLVAIPRDLLWIWLRSQMTVQGPPISPLSCCKNSTTSSPWKCSLSPSSMKCNPTRNTRGLSVIALITEIRW